MNHGLTFARMTSIPVLMCVGLAVLFFASGFLAQKTLDKWTQETGRRPLIHGGRGGWGRYMRSVERELPASVSKRIAFWTCIGYFAMILIAVIIVIDSALHKR